MNWMRIAPFPEFRKLWGRIETDLEAGKYTVYVENSKKIFLIIRI